MARRQAPRGAAWESRKRGEAGRGGSGGPMQDAENVAAPEAAEPGQQQQQQQPAAEPPPGEEPPRPTGPGPQEAAGGEDAEAGPEPDVLAKPAEPAADGEERAASAPGSSPPPPSEEPPAPAAGEAPAEQAGDAGAEARSEGAGGEDGGADEPSFSDPEDFVDDVSEEGEAARGWVGGRGVPALHLSSGAEGRPAGVSGSPFLFPLSEISGGGRATWGQLGSLPCALEPGTWRVVMGGSASRSLGRVWQLRSSKAGAPRAALSRVTVPCLQARVPE